MIKKLFLTLFCAVLSAGIAFAQGGSKVNGIVVDEIGEPVIGASVLSKEQRREP